MPQTYFDEEGPTEHDAHLLDDASHSGNDLVPCPNCGKSILAVAERCHHCGEHFPDEAWMLTRSSKHGLYVLAALAALIAFAWLLFGAL